MKAEPLKSQSVKRAIPVSRSLILLLIIVCLEIGGNTVYQHFENLRLNPLFLTAFQRIFGVAIIICLILIWGYGLDSIGLCGKKIKRGVLHGIFWCTGFGLIVGLLGTGLFIFGINPLSLFSYLGPLNLSYLISYYIIGCLIGPVAEDLIFVGLLYNSLRTKLNLIFSVLLVASLFTLSHGFISFSLFIQFIGGVLFTLSFEFSGSLLTPVIIHICGNLAITTLQIL